MRKRKSIQDINKEEIKEILCRKRTADNRWKNVFERYLSGEKVSNEELSFAMSMCNQADFLCLQKGLL